MAPEGDETAPEDPAQPVAFDQGAEEQDSDEDEAQAYASKPMRQREVNQVVMVSREPYLWKRSQAAQRSLVAIIYV